MQTIESHRKCAQTQSRVAREPIPFHERAAYSPTEFAALFGRSPTWGYRQIYAGRIKPIADCGRLLVPHTEVDSILARRREYNPIQAPVGVEPGVPTPAREAGGIRTRARSDKTAARSYGAATGGRR